MVAADVTVSIVMATYNCSHLVRFAIQSVLDSRISDWELLVVGDACTDDTEQVVARFGDPRITFHNLATNSGEQSVPNNHGVRLARGRYIAFLNQDDMYFPNHLASCIAELERTGADLVLVPCASIRPATRAELADDRWEADLTGVPPERPYSPHAFYVASTWVLRRSLSDRVGPWRRPHELYTTPSQDWLYRAWRSGAGLAFLPHVSVIAIASGARRNSYITRSTFEHEYYSAQMRTNPSFRERLLESAAINTVQLHRHELMNRPMKGIARAASFPIAALLSRMGIHPSSATVVLKPGGRFGLGGKGKQIQAIRRYTGLS
jgi:glycosyltransferase involved in cell wall biosynthesis